MKMIIIIFGLVVISLVVFAVMQHRHNENCKWVAPLRTEYVMCSDGKVRYK